MKLIQVITLTLLLIAFQSSSHNTNEQIKKTIATNSAPKAIGPYSQAIQVGNTLYLAGQIAIVPKTGKMTQNTIEQQTHQVMKNIDAVLKAAGFSLNDVVQSQVYLKNLDHYQAMNKIYATYFTNSAPVRAVVEVNKLPRNALIEIMVTAVK